MPTFSQFLQEHCEKMPDNVSVALLNTNKPDRPVTYSQIPQGTSEYIKTLEENRVCPDAMVLLILKHGIGLFYAFYGIVPHGTIPLILSFLTEKLLPEGYRVALAMQVSATRSTGDFGYQVKDELYMTGQKKYLIIAGAKNINSQNLELLAHEFSGLHAR